MKRTLAMLLAALTVISMIACYGRMEMISQEENGYMSSGTQPGYVTEPTESAAYEESGPFIPANHTYSIIGSVEGTNWDTDFGMTPDGKNTWRAEITMKAGDEFKVRADMSWDYNWGNGFNGDPLRCEADGLYVVSIVFYGENGAVSYWQRGEAYEDGGSTYIPSEHTYGVIGSFADSSNWTNDVQMTPDGENTWRAEIAMKAGDEFKVRADGQWDNNWGEGFYSENFRCEADGLYVVTITFDGKNGMVSYWRQGEASEPTYADAETQYRNLIESAKQAKNNNDFEAFRALFVNTNENVIRDYFNSDWSKPMLNMIVIGPENGYYWGSCSMYHVEGRYPDTHMDALNHSDGLRYSDGVLRFDFSDEAAAAAKQIYEKETVSFLENHWTGFCTFNKANDVMFYGDSRNYMWLKDDAVYRDTLYVSPIRIWQGMNGDVYAAVWYANGTDAYRTVTETRLTLTDDALGTVLNVTLHETVTIPANRSTVVIFTIPAYNVQTGTQSWTTVHADTAWSAD